MKILSNQEPFIPLDNNKFYIIKLAEWDFSVDILIYNKELEINIENLYLIFKSYLINEDILIKAIYLIATNNKSHKNVNIFYKINLKKIKRYNLRKFEDWIYEVYETDEHYFKEFEYIGFRVIFFKESKYWINKELYPIYPWKEKVLNLL